jgi:hypothetical protein
MHDDRPGDLRTRDAHRGLVLVATDTGSDARSLYVIVLTQTGDDENCSRLSG